jgi:hypothetical protein
MQPNNSGFGDLINSMKYRQVFITIATVLLFASILFGEDAIYKAEHLMQCGSWELVFYESGFVHESWNSSCGEDSQSFSRLHHITHNQLESVRKALSQAKFRELPDSIEPATFIADEDMYVISDFTTKPNKTVSAIGLERAVNAEIANRFSQAWKLINTIVQEPTFK